MNLARLIGPVHDASASHDRSGHPGKRDTRHKGSHERDQKMRERWHAMAAIPARERVGNQRRSTWRAEKAFSRPSAMGKRAFFGKCPAVSCCNRSLNFIKS